MGQRSQKLSCCLLRNRKKRNTGAGICAQQIRRRRNKSLRHIRADTFCRPFFSDAIERFLGGIYLQNMHMITTLTFASGCRSGGLRPIVNTGWSDHQVSFFGERGSWRGRERQNVTSCRFGLLSPEYQTLIYPLTDLGTARKSWKGRGVWLRTASRGVPSGIRLERPLLAEHGLKVQAGTTKHSSEFGHTAVVCALCTVSALTPDRKDRTTK